MATLLPNFFTCYLKSNFVGKGYAACLKACAPQEALGSGHESTLQHLHSWMASLILLAGQVAAAELQHHGGLQEIPASEHIKQ